MIHPYTRVAPANEVIGVGVFATQFMPRGTIVVVTDPCDLRLPLDAWRSLSEPLRSALESVAYVDREGVLIVSWDHAKYMNHRCDCNTMMTAYGFEIAIRDIHPGDELTTEYGMLNVLEPYPLKCGCLNCRGTLARDDMLRYADDWDARVRASLLKLVDCEQPLLPLVPPGVIAEVLALRDDDSGYRSVRALAWPT